MDELGKRSAWIALLYRDSPYVRYAAAAGTLTANESRANSILLALIDEDGHVGFAAKVILQKWRSGNFEL